jgi:hypothetical protein
MTPDSTEVMASVATSCRVVRVTPPGSCAGGTGAIDGFIIPGRAAADIIAEKSPSGRPGTLPEICGIEADPPWGSGIAGCRPEGSGCPIIGVIACGMTCDGERTAAASWAAV